jgi:uncharacterized membrane protein
MPDKMASHWNINNRVDGYMSKPWALFMFPVLSIILYIFFIILPKIEPLKENLAQFIKYFDRFMIIFFLFMFYIYALTLIWNKGTTFNMARFISPAFGILFIYIGILLKHSKQNWFIGIRTPWTLSNERVWEKTHKIGSLLFMISGLLCFIGILFPNIAFYIVILPVLFTAAFVISYSYFEYKRLVQKTKV